jgi:hypothetical protein
MTSQASNFRSRVLAGRARNRRLDPADELFSRGAFEHQGHPLHGIVPTVREKQPSQFWAVTSPASIVLLVLIVAVVTIFIANLIAQAELVARVSRDLQYKAFVRSFGGDTEAFSLL